MELRNPIMLAPRTVTSSSLTFPDSDYYVPACMRRFEACLVMPNVSSGVRVVRTFDKIPTLRPDNF